MSRPAVINKDCPAWGWSELDNRAKQPVVNLAKQPVVNLAKGQCVRFLHICAEQDGYAGYSLCLTPSGQTVVVASHNLDLVML